MGIIFHSPTSNKIRLVSWVDQESRALPTQERDTTDDEDELVMCRSAGVASRIIIRICSGRTRRLARHGRFLPRSGTRNQDTGHNRVVLGRRTRSIGLRAGTTVQSRCAIHDLGSGCIGFCSRQAQAIKCKLRRNPEAARVGGLFCFKMPERPCLDARRLSENKSGAFGITRALPVFANDHVPTVGMRPANYSA